MIHNFLHYYKPYKSILYGVVIGSLVAALLDLVFPMLVRQILNEVLPQKNTDRLLHDTGILFILYLGNYGLLYLVNYYGHLMSAKIENDMRRDLFEHLQKMSFKYFDNAKTGQLLSRLTSDIAEIGELSFRGPNDVIVCCITMIGTIGILFWMNFYLGLLIAVLLIGKTLHTVYVNKKMKAAFRENRIKSGEITARAEESLGGIRLVKAFAQEEYELKRFMEKSLDFLETRRKSYKILAYFSGSVNFFTNITNLLILACGGLLIAKDKLSLSDFVAFLLYVNLFMKPLLRLTVFTEMYQRGMAGFQRFYEIMEMKPEIIDLENAVICKKIRGEIEFDNLVFGYSDQKKVIKGFNLKIAPGQTVAFVGETGAGKTTIASLLLRFYEPLSGRILIDGIDIRQYKQQKLRRNIGIVQQDVFLFSDSVAYNIAYSKPGAEAKEVEKAAVMAAADRFIKNLPYKYATEIGERGVKLSGGQKQRLAIARVFLKNPPIVILDEATSSLDNYTEKLIQESLDKLAENRTTLIIAHRMSTIKNADKIIVLNNGEVAEIGTHSTLMLKGGLYYNLYNAQKQTDDK
ncbi:ABC transporter ATP-binding protein [Phascolarctobacterium faecium]|uniref:ABC transporter ATP-binding protein n=1 Tax=Phascolarctobacterium faecium TaxID=33025 RepID=UPI001FCC4022|nr:ABC transporter ATP-binding protein [Phascolarctobacterium faecium]MCQ5184302.1 ABC transporter ATP-binding protein/permease [Phascolarctobacterium faecium]BDE84274.1 multidrug ABC transporter ATP-binding protein [Phascolarctobacterium faecium]BDE93400.1 multidrug ABC transporter ATP-binding protein [Phascolarctobacterium faecium]